MHFPEHSFCFLPSWSNKCFFRERKQNLTQRFQKSSELDIASCNPSSEVLSWVSNYKQFLRASKLGARGRGYSYSSSLPALHVVNFSLFVFFTRSCSLSIVCLRELRLAVSRCTETRFHSLNSRRLQSIYFFSDIPFDHRCGT